MPSWPVRVLLVALWLGALAWHAAVEWRSAGAAPLTFRAALAELPHDETAEWALSVDGQPAGNSHSTVEVLPEGGHRLRSNATVEGAAIAGLGGQRVRIATDALVSPFGRLREFTASAGLDGTELRVELVGTVQGEELVLRIAACTPPLPEAFRGPFSAPYDGRTPLAGAFAPPDRIPDLAIGKRWTTVAFDPMAFLGPRLPGFASSPAPPIAHEVVGRELLDWHGAAVDCFVVEDRHPAAAGKTFVRAADGRTVRQEAKHGGKTLVLERKR